MDKVICVGKNYLKHALELGDEVPKEPLYFFKPPSSTLVLQADKPINVILPYHLGEIHHELELVFKLGEGAKLTHYTFGLDLTLRNVQSDLKKKGQPWEKAKAFLNSAIVGPWQKVTSLEDILNKRFELRVNDQVRQAGYGRDMRFSPSQLIHDLKQYFLLCDGDWLFTGTPEGVGPLRANDHVSVECESFKYAFNV